MSIDFTASLDCVLCVHEFGGLKPGASLCHGGICQCLETLQVVTTLQVNATGFYLLQARDIDKTSCIAPSQFTKNFPAPNANSGEIGKPP